MSIPRRFVTSRSQISAMSDLSVVEESGAISLFYKWKLGSARSCGTGAMDFVAYWVHKARGVERPEVVTMLKGVGESDSMKTE